MYICCFGVLPLACRDARMRLYRVGAFSFFLAFQVAETRHATDLRFRAEGGYISMRSGSSSVQSFT